MNVTQGTVKREEEGQKKKQQSSIGCIAAKGREGEGR